MVLAAAVLTGVPLQAATATDFYVELLRRGVTEVEAGRNDAAVTPLRLAAFGLIDSIEHYQTAQAYLVVALDRMNQTDAAREAAERIIAAERIERKFASLRLPETIRTSFATSAKKLLPATDVALLSAPPPPPQQSSSRQVSQSSSLPVSQPPSRTVEFPGSPAESSSRPVVESPSRTTAPVTTTSTPPTTRKPEDPKTRRPEDPKTAAKPAAPAKPALDVPARIAAGERALGAANLTDARRIYRELLEAGGHDHATWIRVGEGLYRSRDFPGALAAFQRVGTLRSGEEAYRYYVAVAHYETGQYDAARRELAAALPFIEITPDVQRYRAKIENAR